MGQQLPVHAPREFYHYIVFAAVRRWNGRPLILLCVAFSPDGALIASGDDDKTLTIRDAKNRSQDEDDTAVVHTITDHKVDVRCVAFSPTQPQIALSDSSGLVLLHALPRQERDELVLLYRFSTRKYTPSLGYSPNGSQLVICHHGGFHKLDFPTNKLFVLNACTNRGSASVSKHLAQSAWMQ